MTVDEALEILRSRHAYYNALLLNPWFIACTRLKLKSLFLISQKWNLAMNLYINNLLNIF